MSINQVLSRIFRFFCTIFTLTTLLSSIINLALGQPSENHGHILDRAVLCLIGSLVLTVMLEVNFKPKFLNYLVPYFIHISLALAYVFISSFWQDPHPHAYRETFS